MKNKGIAQILLIIGVIVVVLVFAFYFRQSQVNKPTSVQPPAKIETVDESLSNLENNFADLPTFEEDFYAKDFIELENDFSSIDLSQI